MHVGARDAAVGRDRAVELAVGEAQQRARAVGAFRLADMHLIASERRAVRKARAFDLAQHLLAGQHRGDVEQLEALDLVRRPLDAVRVGHAFAQHLVAAANAEHAPAAPRMGGEVDIPALLAKEFEIGDGRLAAGQDDEIGDRQRLACA